jgi:sugar O-acyltransferase (sialic acid O-acetyltransferase NeuD family)
MVEARGLGIIGAGEHGRVAADAWIASGGQLTAYYDDGTPPTHLLRAPLAGDSAAAVAMGGALHVAIGSNAARRKVGDVLEDDRCPLVIHPRAVVSRYAALGAGTLLCAAAVVQTDAKIGRHVIVNTGAVVEHDCIIADFVHLAPRTVLGGSVQIGVAAFIGIGAIILPGVRIGEGAVVGAGAVVLKDVVAHSVVVGNPARVIFPSG